MSVQSDNPAPTYVDRPIGIDATGTRTEFDHLGNRRSARGSVLGRADAAVVQRFSIGNDHMPIEVYRAYGLIKKACALVNERAGRLEPWRARVIVQAAEETIAGKLDDQFPLYVWQTGSGTQSNMNVNEVLSNRAIQLLGREAGQPESGGPERPRQHGPKQQRHLSHRDAHHHAHRDR